MTRCQPAPTLANSPGSARVRESVIRRQGRPGSGGRAGAIPVPVLVAALGPVRCRLAAACGVTLQAPLAHAGGYRPSSSLRFDPGFETGPAQTVNHTGQGHDEHDDRLESCLQAKLLLNIGSRAQTVPGRLPAASPGGPRDP